MKGMLFGIGVGPGDPELLTLKSINTIKKCDVIAYPKTGDGKGAAFSIIEEYLDGKEMLACRFAMAMNLEKLDDSRQIVSDDITRLLNQGKNVGFITLGDPTTYSTYMYIHQIITKKGFCADIIPGITSFATAAAALGIALCEWDETLTIIPIQDGGNIDELLDYPGNKVIMKSGKHLGSVLDKLKARRYDVKIASRVSMEGQRLYESIEEYEKSPESGYFTIAIARTGRQTKGAK